MSKPLKLRTKSMKLNASLNIIRTILAIIFQLITFPYLSRVLGVESIGSIGYSVSIIGYFSLIASLGITIYAEREAAKVRENPLLFQEIASEIFSINLLTTVFSYFLLGILLFWSDALKGYFWLIVLQSLSILFTTLSVEWINIIYEDYLAITLRTILSYFCSLVLILILVKTPSDIYRYIIITLLANFFICLFNQIYIRRYVKLSLVFSNKLFTHLRGALLFFVNNLSISIYVNIDTTMLGYFSGDYSVGLYTTAVKIYSIIKTVLAAIYIVVISRLSLLAGKDDFAQFKIVLTSVVGWIILLLIPTTIGVFVVSEEIIYLLVGQSYLAAAVSLKILSFSLLFAIFGGLLSNCVNIPLGREKINIKATAVAATSNIILNFLAIPIFKENGAAFTTLLAEFTVFILLFVSVRDWNKIIVTRQVLKYVIDASLGGLVILVINFLILTNLEIPVLLLLIVKIVVSSIAYSTVLLIRQNEDFLRLLKMINVKNRGVEHYE